MRCTRARFPCFSLLGAEMRRAHRARSSFSLLPPRRPSMPLGPTTKDGVLNNRPWAGDLPTGRESPCLRTAPSGRQPPIAPPGSLNRATTAPRGHKLGNRHKTAEKVRSEICGTSPCRAAAQYRRRGAAQTRGSAPPQTRVRRGPKESQRVLEILGERWGSAGTART